MASENNALLSFREVGLLVPNQPCSDLSDSFKCLNNPNLFFVQGTILQLSLRLTDNNIVVDLWMECLPGFYKVKNDNLTSSYSYIDSNTLFFMIASHIFSVDLNLANSMHSFDVLLSKKNEKNLYDYQKDSFHEIRKSSSLMSSTSDIFYSLLSPVLPHGSNSGSSPAHEFIKIDSGNGDWSLHKHYCGAHQMSSNNSYTAIFDAMSIIGKLSGNNLDLNIPFNLMNDIFKENQITLAENLWRPNISDKDSNHTFICSHIRNEVLDFQPKNLKKQYSNLLSQLLKELSDITVFLFLTRSFLFS